MTNREVLKQALEALESDNPYLGYLAAHAIRNFCPRCGKRTADLTTIHTCTPPRENT